MIIEKTSRTKECTDCGMIAHNTVMHTHTCEVEKVIEKKEVKKTKKK